MTFVVRSNIEEKAEEVFANITNFIQYGNEPNMPTKPSEQHEALDAATFRTLLMESLLGIGIFQDNQIIFANPALAEITGNALDDLFSMSLKDAFAWVHPDDGVYHDFRNPGNR